MKKFLLSFLISLMILCGIAEAQTYFFYRYREHATDCTSITDGNKYDLCYEIDDQAFYKCVPSAGTCDTAGEWKVSESNLRADPGACTSGQYVTDIGQDGTLTCGQVAFSQLSGAATDGQVPDNITISLSATATALAANGTNCSTGNYPLGVNASGTVESCTAAAPTTVDYIVGTADGTLSNEIVAGTSPGGELGGTWSSPTIDDSVAVTSWNLTTPVFSGKVNADGSSVNDDDCTGEQGLYWYDDTDSSFEFCNANSGAPVSVGSGGAPTDADYLVGTSNGSLSAEIVVGTSPGGELGGTWGTPTLDDSVTVTGWAMGDSTATTPAADDNDTSLATTAYVQGEINGAGGTSLSCSSGVCNADDELYTRNWTFNLDSPSTGETGRWQSKCNSPQGCTITHVACDTDTGTVTINLDERAAATPNTTGSSVLSAGLVCDTNNQTSCSSGCDVNTITNGSIDFTDPTALLITATASSPTIVRVHVRYTTVD